MTTDITIKEQGKEVEGQTSHGESFPKSGSEVQERAIEPTKIGRKREKAPKQATDKQIKYVQLRQEHPEYSKLKCAKLAGYSRTTTSVTNVEKSPIIKNRLTEAMYRKGITEDKISIRLNEALNAQNCVNKRIKGADGRFIDVETRSPDHNIRLQALKFSTEILGYGREKEEQTPNVVIHFHQRKEYEPVEAEVLGQRAGGLGFGVDPPTPRGR